MKTNNTFAAKRWLAGASVALLVLAGCTSGQDDSGGGGSGDGSLGLPDETTVETMREVAGETFEGATVGFVPGTLGLTFTDSWHAEFERTFADMGIEYSVKDPGNDPERMIQNVQAYISEEPDVLLVHNLDVGILQDVLVEAQEAGIYVVQLNLQSLTVTDAYVGPDYKAEGTLNGDLMTEHCSGGEVGVIRAAPGSTADDWIVEGFTEVAEENDINIVSEQAAGLDPSAAASQAQSMLLQNPDLCGIFGTFDDTTIGAANAVRDEGRQDDVVVISAGGGDSACQGVKDGLFTAATSTGGMRVAIMATSTVQTLLQSNLEPGEASFAMYTPLVTVTDDNYYAHNVCFTVSE